jgi:hypothetical protein
MSDIEVAPAAPAAPATAPETQTSAPVEGQTTTEGQQPDAPDTQPPAPKRGASQRIQELTYQRHEAERQAQQYRSELEQIRRQQALNQQFSQIQAKAPDINRYNSLAEYQMAMADWTAERASAVANAQWEERQQQVEQQRAAQAQQFHREQLQLAHENVTLENKMAAGVKKYPDFMQVVTSEDIGSVRNTPLFGLILECDNSADIAYSLAKNPGEIDRLLSLRSLPAMAAAVMKLDAKFSGHAAASPPPAPPPSRNGTTAAGPKDWSDMSTAEHIRAYRERKSKRA